MDPGPLMKELSAVEREVDGVSVLIDDDWSKPGGVRDALLAAGSESFLTGARSRSESQLLIRTVWLRFREHWRLEHVRAFWPYVSDALHRPVVCSDCGVSLEPKLPHVAQTVRCRTCGAANAVSPAAHVALYFAIAPEVVACAQAVELRIAILRRRRHWEDAWLAALVSQGPRPDEDAVLHELRGMERKYWIAFARAKASVDLCSENEQRRLVDAAMRRFEQDEVLRIVLAGRDAVSKPPASGVYAATVGVAPEECVFPLVVLRGADRGGPLREESLQAELAQGARAPRVGGDPVLSARAARNDIGPTGTVVLAPGAVTTVEGEMATQLPTLTAADYAEVLAHTMFGGRGGRAIFARWGLEDDGVRRKVLDGWAERIRRNPTEVEQWNRLYAEAISRLDLP